MPTRFEVDSSPASLEKYLKCTWHGVGGVTGYKTSSLYNHAIEFPAHLHVWETKTNSCMNLQKRSCQVFNWYKKTNSAD